jgi:hypothetical protein
MSAKAELRKFNADLIRNIGFVFSTPFCIQISYFLTFKPELINFNLTQFILSAILMLVGLRFIYQSFLIMEKGLIKDA